jgi:hypothetical protein
MNRTRTCGCPSKEQHVAISAMRQIGIATEEEEEEEETQQHINSQQITVKLRFIILQSDINIDLLLDQNIVYLNNVMRSINFSELNMVPLNFQQTIGNANMKFVSTIVKVENVTETFSSLINIMLSYDKQTTSGNINVFICKLNEPLLGEALFGGNVMCIDFKTVGSPLHPNFYGNASINRGKTLVHELGHCLGLHHIFYGNTCKKIFEDIPSQIKPNNVAFLAFQTSTNTFIPYLDNRHHDCKENSQPHYSCLIKLNIPCDGFLSEAFFNFMDYSPDFFLITFSKDQCKSMRKLVKNNMSLFGATLEKNTEIPEIPEIREINRNLNYHIVIVILVFVFIVIFSIIVFLNVFDAE